MDVQHSAASPWARWLTHFECQRHRPLPHIDGMLGLPPETLRVLGASLARFQLGETGEGRIVREVEHFHASGIDDRYRRALDLFVREEGRHARILREALMTLGVAVLEREWTSQLFKRARQLFGIRFKLLVLLVAEIAAVVAYGALVEHLPASSLRTALEQMHADEEHHLGFHGDFFKLTSSSALRRGAFALALSLLVPAALLVVLLDHHRTWRALSVSRRELWQNARARTMQTIRHVCAQKYRSSAGLFGIRA